MPEVPPLPGWDNQEHLQGDFPGDPVVKTLPSNAEGTGSIPGWEAKILHASARKQNNSNNKNKGSIATNSIKTFKMVHIKKKKKMVKKNISIYCQMFPEGAKSPQFRTTGLWPYKPTFQGSVFWNLFLQLFIHSIIHWTFNKPLVCNRCHSKHWGFNSEPGSCSSGADILGGTLAQKQPGQL